jgi:hypothetical protein
VASHFAPQWKHSRLECFLGVPDLTRFVDVFARKPDVRCRWFIVPVWNIYRLANRCDFAALLRRVVFVG